MNCYEWRKHVTGTVSVDFDYNGTGDGFTISGAGTITHGALYTGWTRRELQCLGSPQAFEPNWILRGDNLCQGRAEIVGKLTPDNTITMTITPDVGDPFETEWGIFWQIIGEDYKVIDDNMLPVNPYPTLENDPYSVAFRKQIDDLTAPQLRVGIGPSFSGAPVPNSAPIIWLKNGEKGESEDGFLKVELSVSFTLT